MSGRRISLADFPEVLRQRLKDDAELVRKAMREAARRGESEAVALTSERDAVDLDFYRLAWRGGSKATKDGAELRNNAPYAAVIEYGRRPMRPGPPLAPILAWVESKLVRNGQVEPGDAWWVAESIRRHIHIKGTPPRGILFDVVKEMRKWSRDEAIQLLRAKAAQMKRGKT